MSADDMQAVIDALEWMMRPGSQVVTWISAEPLLERIVWRADGALSNPRERPQVDLIIVGGESDGSITGQSTKARQCYIAWIRDGIAQSREAQAHPFVKRLRSWPHRDGRVSDPKLLLVRHWSAYRVFYSLSEHPVRLEHPPAKPVGYLFDRNDDRDHEDHIGQHVAVAEHARRHLQLKAETAGSEDTQSDRQPQVHIERVEQRRDDRRRCLRQNRKSENLARRRAGRL